MAKHKLAVLADTRGGDTYAVGPVFTDTAVQQLREEIDQRGDIVRGTIRLISAAQFRAEAE